MDPCARVNIKRITLCHSIVSETTQIRDMGVKLNILFSPPYLEFVLLLGVKNGQRRIFAYLLNV